MKKDFFSLFRINNSLEIIVCTHTPIACKCQHIQNKPSPPVIIAEYYYEHISYYWIKLYLFFMWTNNNWQKQRFDFLLQIIRQFTRLCIMYFVLNTLVCLWKLNTMLYCVFRIPIVFFFFVAFKQFDSTKPSQLLKTKPLYRW